MLSTGCDKTNKHTCVICVCYRQLQGAQKMEGDSSTRIQELQDMLQESRTQNRYREAKPFLISCKM